MVSDNHDLGDGGPHGTTIAGIVAAVTDNGHGIAGVAGGVSIAVVRVTESTVATVANVVKGIDYARGIRADVINASFTTSYHRALENAVVDAGEEGLILVAAAGGGGHDLDDAPTYPAAFAFDHVIAVASTNEQDGLEVGSSYGDATVELGAPGVAVVSTFNDGGYRVRSGTSVAAPHVTGTVALLRSLEPVPDLAKIRECLANGDPTLAGRTEWGVRLNAGKALASCATASPEDASARGAGCGRPAWPSLLEFRASP